MIDCDRFVVPAWRCQRFTDGMCLVDLPIFDLYDHRRLTFLAQEAEISGTQDTFSDRVGLTRRETFGFMHFDRVFGDFWVPKVLIWHGIVVAPVS
jgi:hypothetical protein